MITEEEVERAVIEAFKAVFKKWKREEKAAELGLVA